MILYDCYDEHKKHIKIVFANDCCDCIKQCPNVKFVLAIDYATRRTKWMKINNNGCWFDSWYY